MVAKERPNAIILDLTMPGMSGFEVLDVLKNERGHQRYSSGDLYLTYPHRVREATINGEDSRDPEQGRTSAG